MSRSLSVDLEVGKNDGRIHALAGVRPDMDVSFTYMHRRGGLPEALSRMDVLADGADFVLGHNLIDFDLPHLRAANPQLRLLQLPAVDTLRLNPLAFPRNPYHHLVKHYQDGALRRGRINDPELDARLALQVFHDQLEALPKASRDLLMAWHWLTTADGGAGFEKVFANLRNAPRPSDGEANNAIHRFLESISCQSRADEILANLSDHGWPLAYALAWLSVAGGNSVMPPWVLHQFPEAGRLVRRLRDVACTDPACGWCRERHDARKELTRWFGFPDFRPEPADDDGTPMQRSIVEAAMGGEHVLGILPTGAGKSICYQIPALSRYDKTGALTVVISPLVALMADQVAGGEAPGTPVALTVTSAGLDSLTVSWTAPANTAPPINDYDYRYREKDTSTWTVVTEPAITGTSVTISGLSASTEYEAQVRATNTVGTSAWSNSGAGTTDGTTVINTAPRFGSASTGRELAENTSGVILLASATDDEGDTLIFGLTGDDGEDFTITNPGEIKFAEQPSFEEPTDANSDNVYAFTATVSDGRNATGGSDTAVDDTITVTVTVTNVEEEGLVTLLMESPVLGAALTASLSDPDGRVSGVTWVWERSLDNSTWTTISGATSTDTTSAYTPVDGDVGSYLRATATYTDPEGSGKSAQAVSANKVVIPDVPRKPSGVTATPGDRQVILSWGDPGDASINSYEYHQVTELAKFTASDGAVSDEFGISVSVDGDTMVVGAKQGDGSVRDSGSAYVFVRPSGGDWSGASQVAKLTASDGAAGDQFGTSVSVDGDTIVVGADQDDVDGTIFGSAYVFVRPATGWVNATETAKLTASDSVGNDQFGTSISVDGDAVAVGAYRADGRISNSGSAYVFVKPITGWVNATETAKLTASDGAGSDLFARSLSVSGDTIVVGADGHDGNGANSGSAYVFVKPDTGWETATEKAKLTASDGASGDRFGEAISVDGNTVVVGANGDGDGDKGSGTGSAYVFAKPSDGWVTATETAKLTASDGAAEDYFGISVSVEGDTVVVGAYRDDSNGANSGSGYVFAKPSDGWATATETAKLIASDGATDDYSWYSVSVDGNTIVVGAYRDDGSDSDSGSAYVFEAKDWAKIEGSGAQTVEHTVTGLDNGIKYTFGIRAVNGGGSGPVSTSVSATPLVNSPASFASATASRSVDENTVAEQPIGAPVSATDTDGDTMTYSLSGTAASFFNLDASTGQISTRDALDYETRSSYTVTVLVRDGKDADGIDDTSIDDTSSIDDTITVTIRVNNEDDPGTLVLSTESPVEGTALTAILSDPDGSVSGVTWGWATSTDNLTWTAISGATTASYTPPEGGVGSYLRATASYTDGHGPDKKAQASTANAVRLFPLAKPTGVTTTPGNQQVTLSWDDPGDAGITAYEFLQVAELAKITASDRAANDLFGISVSVDGDTMVVGADGHDDGINASGVAYVFARSSGGDWSEASQVARLTVSGGAAGDGFGYSVSVDGDTIVVGADQDDSRSSGRGYACVFIRPAGGWTDATQTAKLTASDGASGDYFGRTVSVDGDTIVVGADEDLDGGGSAYVFVKPSGGWETATETAKLTAYDGAANDRFGASVSVDGDTIVVGAYLDDDNGFHSGSAYVFVKPSAGWATANETAKLTASDGAANDWFGASVSVDEDTIVAGAHQDLGSAGSAYVFVKPATGWGNATEVAKLTASDRAAQDYFGGSVSVEGDTIVVGAHQELGSAGSAHVFVKPATGWGNAMEVAKLTASDGAANDRFGTSVSVDGDTIVVGAYLDDDGGTNSGSVYAFVTSRWAKIEGSGAQTVRHTVTELDNGIRYTFGIRAVDGGGSGPVSTSVSATPLVNSPASFASATASRSVDENTVAEQPIGAPVAAIDPDGDSLIYVLWGPAASSFDLDASTGQISTRDALDYETRSSYTVTVLVRDGKDADGIDDIGIDDTISVTVLVYKAPTTTGDQTTHVVPPGISTATQTLNGGPEVEFPDGATTGKPFQVRVDPRPAGCEISPSEGTLITCVQVDLFDLAGTPWVGVTPFDSANVIISVSNPQGISVYRREGPSDSWTSIPPCEVGSTAECFTVAGGVVTIQNISDFSQFAVLRPRRSSQVVAPTATATPPSSQVVSPTATATPPPTVILPPTPGGGGAATITCRRRGVPVTQPTATPAPVVVATPSPTEMVVPATDSPVPTSVAPTAVPPTPELRAAVQPTAAPPTPLPTRSGPPTATPPVAPTPTDTPAAVAAIPNTPVPAATTAVPPAVEPGGGFPLWLIAAIVVAVIIAGGLGFGAWRMLRPT